MRVRSGEGATGNTSYQHKQRTTSLASGQHYSNQSYNSAGEYDISESLKTSQK